MDAAHRSVQSDACCCLADAGSFGNNRTVQVGLHLLGKGGCPFRPEIVLNAVAFPGAQL